MNFDPTKPVNGTTVDADLLRNNFNALKAQIDAIPAGPAGPVGRGIADIRDNHDGTLTVEMTDATSYGPFQLPAGAPGAPGAKGDPGEPGPAGADGSPGPNFNMRGDWQAWEVYNRGDLIAYNGNLYVAFADALSGPPPDGDTRWKLLTLIGPAGPAGADSTVPGPAGNDGVPGPAGADGPAGPQGPAGEVTTAQLAQEIAFAFGGTSANSNTVQPLDETADQAAILAKLNELISALRR